MRWITCSSVSSSVNPSKPRSWSNRLPAGKRYGVASQCADRRGCRRKCHSEKGQVVNSILRATTAKYSKKSALPLRGEAACPDQTQRGNAPERASHERRCQEHTRRREPRNAGYSACSLNPAGECNASRDADLSSNPGPECHQEGRGDAIAKAKPTIGHHKSGKTRIGLTWACWRRPYRFGSIYNQTGRDADGEDRGDTARQPGMVSMAPSKVRQDSPGSWPRRGG